MGKFYYIIILYTISVVLGDKTTIPNISHISKDQTRNVGDKVNLNCTVQNAQEHVVIWLRDSPGGDPIVLSLNTALIVRDLRYSVKKDETTSSFIFSIIDVQERDAGIYKCQVRVSMDITIAAKTTLEVKKQL